MRLSSALIPHSKVLGQPQHDILVEKLVGVLEPVGAHRQQAFASKGKKGTKRKRAVGLHDDQTNTALSPNSTPPTPPIQKRLLVGFNSVTRHLEALSSASRPESFLSDSFANPSKPPASEHIAVVFLLRPLDDLLYSHLPAMCSTASVAHPDLPARLCLLDPAAEERVAGALGGSSRVSLFALLVGDGEDWEDNGVQDLLEYVRAHVEPVEVNWLKEAAGASWMGTKIDVR